MLATTRLASADNQPGLVQPQSGLFQLDAPLACRAVRKQPVRIQEVPIRVDMFVTL